MAGILRACAWISLIGGLAAGVWAFFAARQLGAIAAGLGIGYIFSGVLAWALLLVIVELKEQLERVEYGVADLMSKSERSGPKGKIKSYSAMDRV